MSSLAHWLDAFTRYRVLVCHARDDAWVEHYVVARSMYHARATVKETHRELKGFRRAVVLLEGEEPPHPDEWEIL